MQGTLYIEYGGLAQLGEHLPYKQRVSGSIPLTSINLILWSGGVGVNMPACHAGDRGFKSRPDRFGFVAQLVEHLIEAQGVGSSILSKAIWRDSEEAKRGGL